MMCYLIAKDENIPGCYALKTQHGRHLGEMICDLNQNAPHSGIQIVTISRPAAYGEYAPYRFVDTEEEFRQKVLSM